MKKEIEFTACEHLDFSDSYAAKKDAIVIGSETKICWNRPVIDSSYPSLVQFCKKRGRLNSPESCLSESCKMCSEYNDFSHIVTFEPDI